MQLSKNFNCSSSDFDLNNSKLEINAVKDAGESRKIELSTKTSLNRSYIRCEGTLPDVLTKTFKTEVNAEYSSDAVQSGQPRDCKGMECLPYLVVATIALI